MTDLELMELRQSWKTLNKIFSVRGAALFIQESERKGPEGPKVSAYLEALRTLEKALG